MTVRTTILPRIGTARLAAWAIVGALLLAPAIAMRFTTEVNWGATDFAAAALLLVGGGVALELVSRWTGDPVRRAVSGAGIVAVVAIIWADAAVGIF